MHELLGKVAPCALNLVAPQHLIDQSDNPNIVQFVRSKIDLPQLQADDNLVAKIEPFHEKYNHHAAARIKQISSVYKELGEPDDLIIMICCKKFVPFLHLWFLSCQQNDITVSNNTIVFTLDKVAETEVSALGLKTYYFDNSIYQNAGNSNVFADFRFKSTMFYKNAAILDALKTGANVLFQDVDLIWLQNPVPKLRQSNSLSDIQIMFDGPNPRHYPYYANTGFFYIRNTKYTHCLFETAHRNSSAIFKLGGHQPPLNRIMHHFAMHNLVNIKVLPETKFVNGHLFRLGNDINQKIKNYKSEAIVVHYSWTGNTQEKLQKLEKYDYFGIKIDKQLNSDLLIP